MRAAEFLRFLCGGAWDPPSDALVTIHRAKGKKSIHIPVRDVLADQDGGDEELFEIIGKDDLYAHPGFRRAPDFDGQLARGGKRDVLAFGAFVLDIDTAAPSGAHAADNTTLPQNEDDVLEILSVAPVLPSVVIHSGHGYQPWWMFDKPIETRSSSAQNHGNTLHRAFVEPFLRKARELGFQMDPCVGISHMYRLPGTLNAKRKAKHGKVSEVVVIDGTYERYSLSQLLPEICLPPVPEVRSVTTSGAPAPVLAASDLEPVRDAMRNLKGGHKHKTAMKAVLEGQSFAKKGERRDEAMYAIVSTIAWLTPARRPGLTAEVLAELLRPSLSIWAAEPDAEKSLEEEMDKARTKFESALDNRAEEDERMAKDAASILGGLRAAGQPVSKKVINGTAINHAIIQDRTKLYVWNFGEQDIRLDRVGYHGPVDRETLFNTCRDLWKNKDVQFSLKYINDKGQEKNKSEKRLIEDYGVAALDMMGEMALQDTYFDVKTRTLHRAVCPLRDLTPLFDPLIDDWLHLLGASNPDKLFDWLATVTKLEEQNCALYLEGDPGVGKNLLAVGLSRLWRTTGPCKFEVAASSFNADMFSCPLIFLDEGAKQDNYRGQASTFIRSLIGSGEHSLNQKNQPIQKVVGCIRFLIAANNENVLSQIANEDLGEADLEAISGRFLHIRADSLASVAYVQEHKTLLKSWTDDDLIARHVLHLVENRDVPVGKRFLVEGETSSIHKALINKGDRNEIVLQWLASLVTMPEKLAKRYLSRKEEPLALVGDGGVFVNTRAYTDHYKLYDTEVEVRLLPGVVSRILANLSGGKQRRVGSGSARYHEINSARILEWAERTQIGDLEKMKENVEKELKLWT